MLILIHGSSGSGKSRWAEALAATASCTKYYVATMVAQNEENLLRIQKHRKQRSGLGFITLEEPCRVGKLPVEEDSLVLLEDSSNLLGNMLFSEHGTADDALREILLLKKRCRHLLVVSISGLDEGGYDGETAEYVKSIAVLNENLFLAADAVVKLTDGHPTLQKGDPYGLA